MPAFLGFLGTIGTAVASAVGATGAAAAAIAAGVTTVLQVGISIGLQFLAQALLKPSAPKPEDVQQSIRQPAQPRVRHYGRVKVSGPWVFADSDSGNLYKLIALGQGPIDAIEEYWVDDELVTLDGGGWTMDGKAEGEIRIEARLGQVPETHYGFLGDVFPEWTAAHRGDGVASLLAYQDAAPEEKYLERFPNGIETKYRVVLRGVRVKNPVSGDTEWSDNAAAIMLDYLQHRDGMRLPASIFATPQALAAWQEGFNRCAEAVTLKGGGSEPRYRLWGSYYLNERPADVIGRMLVCCDGRLYPTADGGLALDIGEWAEPAVVLDESVIVGFSDLARGKDILNTANVIRATYQGGADQDFQTTDADPWMEEDDITLRGEIESAVDFAMSPSHGQTRRLMKLAAWRANPLWVGTIQCNLGGLTAIGERFVRLDLPSFGISEVCEVQNLQMLIGEGNLLQGVIIEIASMPAEAYQWDPATEEGTAPVAEISEGDHDIPVPAGTTFTESIQTSAGSPRSIGVLTFAAPPSVSLRVEAQYKKVAAADWLAITVAPEATSAQTAALDDGVQYEARIRYVSGTNRSGDWISPTLTLTPTADPVVPKALSSFTLTGSAPYLGNAPFSIVTQSDGHLRTVALYRVPSGAALDRVAHLVTRIPVTTVPATYSYTDGDTSRTNILVNGVFSADTNWSKGTGWTIAAGVATHAAGTGANLMQTIPAFSTVTYRVGYVVSGMTAGAFFPFLSPPLLGGATVTTNGQKFTTITPATGGGTNFGINANAAAAGSVDDVILYQQSASCAPAGQWDYYAEPINPSGVAGALAGPIAVTVI